MTSSSRDTRATTPVSSKPVTTAGTFRVRPVADPVPADEAGGALAVARPHLPELVDFLDAGQVPIAVALALDDDRLRAVAREIVRLGRVTDAGRLAVGAALHDRRGRYPRGRWTPFVASLADDLGVKTETLGRWMLAAQEHYGLEPPKAAKPTLRGRRPPAIRASDADTKSAAEISAGRGATTAPSKGPGPVPPPAAAPGGDDSPGTGGHSPVSPPDAVGCDIGQKAIPAEVTPRPDLDPVTDALADLLVAPSVVLAIVARDHRGTVLAVQRALTRALADSEGRPARPAVEVFEAATCPHPKDRRDVKPYATICGACGVRVR